MKKQLFLALILIFAFSAFLMAGTPRIYLQRCSLDSGLEAPVTNGATTTDPNYIIHATNMATSETLGTDLGTPATSIRISRAGTTPNFYTAVTVQLGTFPTQWAAGNVVHMYVQYIPTLEIVEWNMTIPAGTTTINIQSPIQVIPPATPASDTWTYNLQVNGPDGYAVAGPFPGTTDYLATTGALTVEGNTMLGNYTIAAAPAGFHWVVNPIVVVAGDFTGAKVAHVYNATINFALEADPPVDTWTYNLQVNGPDGYAVTGPVNGVTDYLAIDGPHVSATNGLLGAYTIAAAPAGFHWVVNPIVVTAADFTGAKVDHVFNGTITFVLEADPIVDTYTYNLHVNGPDGYFVNGPVGGTTDYIATSAVMTTLLGDYTIAAAPAGFHWLVNPITVISTDFVLAKVDYVYNATIEFVLEADPPVAYTYLITSHNVMNPTGPDLNAEILFSSDPDGIPVSFAVPIYAPYTFGIPGNEPFVTGRYAVQKDCWGYWIPESVSMLAITSDYTSDFLGMDICTQTPVELSSFTATLTSDLFVTLTWVSQTESQMSGYLVYRNTTNDQSTSMMIDHPMIPATNTSSTQSYTVVDNDVTIGTTYYYWLEAVDYTNSTYHGPVSVTVNGNVPPVLPEITSMKNAYPNPFKANGNTSIEVSVKAGENGTVTIYNVLGQVVKTFNVTEGSHMVNWNGKDIRGNACGSGIYFYKLSTPSINQTKKMVIVK